MKCDLCLFTNPDETFRQLESGLTPEVADAITVHMGDALCAFHVADAIRRITR